MGGILCNKLYLYHRYLKISAKQSIKSKGADFPFLDSTECGSFDGLKFHYIRHKVLKSDPMKLVYE